MSTEARVHAALRIGHGGKLPCQVRALCGATDGTLSTARLEVTCEDCRATLESVRHVFGGAVPARIARKLPDGRRLRPGVSDDSQHRHVPETGVGREIMGDKTHPVLIRCGA